MKFKILLILLCLTGSAVAEDALFSNVRVGRISPGSGHIGVDIWWPDSNGDLYNPCHHSSDMYYGACVMSNSGPVSYYKVMHFSDNETDFPYGIFIDNENSNYCTTSSWCRYPLAVAVKHGWGRLVAGAAIEIYPYNSNGYYDPYSSDIGGMRAQVDSFFISANSGRYSSDIGDIILPKSGDPLTGKLNGLITDRGILAEKYRVSLDLFQNGSTWSSSTGYPLSGFSSVSNVDDGYYSSGTVPAGSYKIYITDTKNGRKIVLDEVVITRPFERIDLQLELPCFGYPSCDQISE